MWAGNTSDFAYFAYSTTGATTQIKTASVYPAGNPLTAFSFSTGAIVYLQLANANSVASPKLQLTPYSTGGSALTATTAKEMR